MGFIPVRALLGHANVEETSRFLGLETNSNPTRRDEPHLFSSPSAGQLAASLGTRGGPLIVGMLALDLRGIIVACPAAVEHQCHYPDAEEE